MHLGVYKKESNAQIDPDIVFHPPFINFLHVIQSLRAWKIEIFSAQIIILQQLTPVCRRRHIDFPIIDVTRLPQVFLLCPPACEFKSKA